MSNAPKTWTNDEILREFLRTIVADVYKWAESSADSVCEACADGDRASLKNRLVNLRLGAVLTIFSMIDGATGPSDWPGLKLVNASTGEPLSEDLAAALSRIEDEYL